jgi:hypothetical protein
MAYVPAPPRSGAALVASSPRKVAQSMTGGGRDGTT